MSSFQRSFQQAISSLFNFKILALAFLPTIAAFLSLFFTYVVFWQRWMHGLSSLLANMSLFKWFADLTGLESISDWTATVFLLLAFVPLFYVVSVLLTSLFLMPVVLKFVVQKDFKHLEKKRGGSLFGSIMNALSATILFVIAFFVTLPLWLLPGFQILVPLILTAWLNKKVFLYDVLQDFASIEERKRIEKEEHTGLYGMGIILGLLSYVPLAFFFIPLFAALCYTYFGLYSLDYRRV
ncbi:MAG: EI24 domain-containing protein [Bdellovibrio sp.]